MQILTAALLNIRKFLLISKKLPTFRRTAVFLSCFVKMKSAVHRNVGNFTGQHNLTFQNVYVFETRQLANLIEHVAKFQCIGIVVISQIVLTEKLIAN